MISMYNFILVIIALFSVQIVDTYLHILFPKKKSMTFGRGLALYGIYFLLQLAIYLHQGAVPLQVLIINIVVVFIISVYICDSSIKSCLLSIIILHILWMAAELLVGYMFIGIGVAPSDIALVGSIVSKILIFSCIKTLGKYRKGFMLNDISSKYWVLLLFVPISSIYIIHNIFKIIGNEQSEATFAFISSILIILINYIIFSVYDKVDEKHELQKQNIIFQQQLEAYNKQLTEREDVTQETRKMKHDMKQHLIYLNQQLIKKEYGFAQDYLKNLIEESVSSTYEISKSGNIVVDTMVNYKYSMAQKSGIPFKARIFIPTELPFHKGDLCIILGNALDNAIEAAEKVEIPGRFIETAIVYSKGTLSILVKNSFEEPIQRDHKGIILTTKPNRENHGIGLISMKKAVKKYNGAMVIEDTDKVFVLKILLYEQ